jgi:DNA-binding CsgD family transcriptional regulator
MTAHATAPPVDAQVLGGLLLDLYRFARELPLADFQRRVLERLSEALPFDSAWWGMSELDRELHSSFPFRLPADYVDAWRAIRGHDLMADAVIGTPSVTANFDTARLHATPTFAAFMDAYDIRQSMCTLLMNPTLNLTTFLSLYRQGPDAQPFSEAERQFKQLVMPHLWAAWTSNWISQLASAKAHSYSSRVTLAVADQKGVLHAAEARFSVLMQHEWPQWIGPELPVEIRAGLGDERPVERTYLTTRVIAVSGLYLVEVRRRSPLDRLTPRELLVAEHFGSGRSYKEIAAALPVSPATVRAHLRAIYSKLEISDKTELAALLSAHSEVGSPAEYN